MTVRMAAMVGCDGGKPSARTASGDHDQRCRNPPPAGSQGCRPVIEPGPSGGRSGCFANMGLALITLGGRASFSVQAQPRQELVTEGGETRATASAEQPRTAAQARLVNLRDESGTVVNQTGALVERGALAAAQHCVPTWTGDAVLDGGVPPPTSARAVRASAAGRSIAGGDPCVENSEGRSPSSLRRGTAGMAVATTGLSPAPVRLTVARWWAKDAWSSRTKVSNGMVVLPRSRGFSTTNAATGPDGSHPIQTGSEAGAASSSASSSNSAWDSGRPRSEIGDANGLRQKPTPWQSGQAQSSQKSPPPRAILERPSLVSFSEPSRDFVRFAAELLGDLTVSPVQRVKADGEALGARVVDRPGDGPEQARYQGGPGNRRCGRDGLQRDHTEAWLSASGGTTRTSCRSGRRSATWTTPRVRRSMAIARSVGQGSAPDSRELMRPRDFRPSL